MSAAPFQLVLPCLHPPSQQGWTGIKKMAWAFLLRIDLTTDLTIDTIQCALCRACACHNSTTSLSEFCTVMLVFSLTYLVPLSSDFACVRATCVCTCVYQKHACVHAYVYCTHIYQKLLFLPCVDEDSEKVHFRTGFLCSHYLYFFRNVSGENPSSDVVLTRNVKC